MKIKPSTGTVYNDGLGGTKVTIQLRTPQPLVEIILSLPFPCAWNGKLLEKIQVFYTDQDGKVVVMLPPSSQIVPLVSRRSPATIYYKLECRPIGALTFTVPDATEWTLGTEITSEKEIEE